MRYIHTGKATRDTDKQEAFLLNRLWITIPVNRRVSHISYSSRSWINRHRLLLAWVEIFRQFAVLSNDYHWWFTRYKTGDFSRLAWYCPVLQHPIIGVDSGVEWRRRGYGNIRLWYCVVCFKERQVILAYCYWYWYKGILNSLLDAFMRRPNIYVVNAGKISLEVLDISYDGVRVNVTHDQPVQRCSLEAKSKYNSEDLHKLVNITIGTSLVSIVLDRYSLHILFCLTCYRYWNCLVGRFEEQCHLSVESDVPFHVRSAVFRHGGSSNL